jgi:TPR repeat protein
MNVVRLAQSTVFLLTACAAAMAMADNRSDYREIVRQAKAVLGRGNGDGPISFVVPADADADLVAALRSSGNIVQRAAVPKSEMYTLPKGYFIVEKITYAGDKGEVVGVAGPGALKGTLGADADCGIRYAISFSRRDGKWANGSYETQSCVPSYVVRNRASKLEDAARKGDAEAQFRLGLNYRSGDDGFPKDQVQAWTWIRKAAQRGNVAAQTTLAFALANGSGVTKDDAEAVSWYRKAALQGNAIGQSYLGAMLIAGRGTKADPVEAATWYRKAAEQGDAQAQLILGAMYEEGFGVAQDKTEAAAWYRKAAAQGSKKAEERLKLL